MRRFLLGEDPRLIERHWDRMYRETAWARGGGVGLLAAISALDEALWDITARSLGVPLYALLGGRVHDVVLPGRIPEPAGHSGALRGRGRLTDPLDLPRRVRMRRAPVPPRPR